MVHDGNGDITMVIKASASDGWSESDLTDCFLFLSISSIPIFKVFSS